MKLLAFAVYDEKAEAYTVPFFQATVGLAIRSFIDACKNEESPFSKHPTDYKLYKIGEFDDSLGMLSGDVPVLVSSGSEAINQIRMVSNERA